MAKYPWASAPPPTSPFHEQPPPPPGFASGTTTAPFFTSSHTGSMPGYQPPPEFYPGSGGEAATRASGYPGAAGMGTASGFQPGTAATMATSVVELSFAARNLRDMDVFSKSDPMVVVYYKPFGNSKWQEVMRTEAISNTLNPDFVAKAKVGYLFEETQPMKFEVYDIDSKSLRLSDHDFIGSCSCHLSQIVTNGSLAMELINPQEGRRTGNGTLIVSSEELSTCKDDLELQFLGKKLDKKDFFGSSDPFLQFSRSNEAGNFVVVHKTEHINNNTSPLWKRFVIPVRTLCNGDLDRNVKVECFDHNKNGNHSLIGEFYVTVRQLQSGPNDSTIFEVINPKKKSKKSYKNSGVVHLVYVEMIRGYSFLDYMRGGTELACTFSIDFTQSNGAPNDPRSLHFIHSRSSNQYELAIKAVGEIIEDYDSDKLYPVLGFGARLPPDGRVSHCFYVNGSDSNPYCSRISGVLGAYKSCINRIQLYGPTNFAPSIHHVANIARQFRDGSQYFILLIITDGIITDMPQTKSAIVEASVLPLSIIIVGVGGADFEAMEELDGDAVRLSYNGKEASRDIVQFVPFRNFLKQGLDSQMARVHLAKEVLAEIPDQFVSYMKTNRIVPKSSDHGLRTLPPDPESITGADF